LILPPRQLAAPRTDLANAGVGASVAIAALSIFRVKERQCVASATKGKTKEAVAWLQHPSPASLLPPEWGEPILENGVVSALSGLRRLSRGRIWIRTTMRAATTERKGAFGRGAFGALLFAFSLLLHVSVGALRAAPVESGWLCVESLGHAQSADAKAGTPPGDAPSGLSHCSDCAMAQSPTLPSKPSIVSFKPLSVTILDFRPLGGVMLEKRRAGETLARAPPFFS
jgi:hypothetical protein